jgi:hypothetical protein
VKIFLLVTRCSKRKEEELSKEMKLGGRSPAYGHHTGVKPLAYFMQDGGKVPLERDTDMSEPHLGFITIVM